MSGISSARSPSEVTDTEYFNPDRSTPSAVYSLLDSVDSESIADEYDIGRYSSTHDLENHVKVGIREGLDPSDSLEELAQTTDTAEGLDYMAASTFSRYTNDRDYSAVVRLLFELFQTRRLYHQRGVQRKRLKWLSRGVIATDATNLTLTRSVTMQEESSTDGDPAEITPSDGGLALHMAARVDVEQKHPVGIGVSQGQSHESPYFDALRDDVEVFADLDSAILVFDRGYTRYARFCEIKHSDDDFVTLLRSDARVDVLKQIQDVEITVRRERDGDRDDTESYRVRDDWIELSETGEEFRRVTLETPDGEVMEYLTTLSPAEYDPIEVIQIYTLRTLIEILFRELKQYLNVENFHSTTLNGVLFELFCSLIGFVLIHWLRQHYPLKDGVADTIQQVRSNWNETLRSFG
ncbi:MAG: IS4 family transposase [Halobacteriales archaeon]